MIDMIMNLPFRQTTICYSHDIIFFLQLHPPNFNTLPVDLLL